MNQRCRQDMPHLEDFLTALVDERGADEGTAVIEQVVPCYSRLYEERAPYDNRALRRHLEETILPGLALYQVLREVGYVEKEALQITAQGFEAWGRQARRRMKMLGRMPFAYQAVRLLARRVTTANFPPEGWEIAWLEVSSRQVAFNIESCFCLDMLRRYGAPELTRVYCDLDDAIYDEVSTHFEWARTKTLGRGDEICDFRFKRVR